MSESDDAALLEVKQLQVGYRQTAILPPVNFAVLPRQCWAIVGRNGSGKTTLLRTLLGLMPPLGGTLHWRADAAIGYIPQRAEVDLAVPARVIDMVLGGAERGWSFLRWSGRRALREHVISVLAEVHIGNLPTRPFSEISEGQKQRVLLARALVANPRILILDEPTSAMDLVSERSIFALIDSLRQQRGLGVVVVAHHVSVLAHYATHLLVLDADDQIAAAGDFKTVASLPMIQERYGRVLTDARAHQEASS